LVAGDSNVPSVWDLVSGGDGEGHIRAVGVGSGYGGDIDLGEVGIVGGDLPVAREVDGETGKGETAPVGGVGKADGSGGVVVEGGEVDGGIGCVWGAGVGSTGTKSE